MTRICLTLLLLTLSFGSPGSTQLPSPRIDVQQKTSLGLQKEVVPDSGTGNFVILGNVEEIQLTCRSIYPTKWIMIPSPHKGGSNIKEWQIDKGRHTFDMKNGKIEFWSKIILRFTNNPHRILNQNAACHHFEDTSVNVNVSISSMGNRVIYGTLIINDVLKRFGKMSERYGGNRNYSLVMHLDVKQKKFECENLNGFQTNPPDLIQCANSDECEASVRQFRDMTNCAEEYDPIDLDFVCTTKTCSSFGTKSGALICEYPEGGRKNSLAQIIYFDFNQNPYFPGEHGMPDISARLKINASGNSHDIYYNGTNAKFRCSGVIWHYSQGIEWVLGNGEDGDITYLGPGKQTTEKRTSYASEIEIIFPHVIGSAKIICMGPLLNSYGWEEVTLETEVKESRAPTILNLTSVISESGNYVTELICDANGAPLPEMDWMKNGVPVSILHYNYIKLVDRLRTRSILAISRTPGEVEEYTCNAFNSIGETNSSVHIKHADESSVSMGVVAGIVLMILLFFLVVGYLYGRLHGNNSKVAWITDFGLSRQLYGYAPYIKKKRGPLPWKWLALESLRDMTFSSMSDVWSYGILLWEIFSLGEVPYPGMTWTYEFFLELQNGLRMTRPKRAPDYIYNKIFMPCWHIDPTQRPSFSSIGQCITDFQLHLNGRPNTDEVDINETENMLIVCLENPGCLIES